MQTTRRALNLVRRTHPSSPFRRPSSHHRSDLASATDVKQNAPTFRHIILSSSSSVPSKQLPSSQASATSALQNSDGIRSLAIGLGSGALGGLCGIGGAVFAIPALLRFTSITSQRVAAGNSLFAVTAVSATAAASFYASSSVDVSIAAPLAISAAVLTPVGARAASNVDVVFLQRALGFFMVLLSPMLPLRDSMQAARDERLAASVEDPTSQQSAEHTAQKESNFALGTAGLAAYGGAVGAFSGFLGIGAGSFITPLLAASYPDMPFHTIMGTSFLTMIFPTAAGAASYMKMGLTAQACLPHLVIGACLGARIGSHLALSVSDELLHKIFAVVIAFMGIRQMRAPSAKQTQAVSNVVSKHAR